MSKPSKKKQQKQKQREERAKKRVAARRAAHLKEKQEARRIEKFERKFRERGTTIVNDPEKQQASEEAKKQRVIQQLERNHAILEALEKEYEAEMAAKKEINDDLEAQGFDSLEEKLEHLNKEAEKKVQENAIGIQKSVEERVQRVKKKKGLKFGGTAETKVVPREKTENQD